MARRSSNGGCLEFIFWSIVLVIVFYILVIVGLAFAWIIIAIIHMIFLYYTILLVSRLTGPKIAMLWLILNIIGMSILIGIVVPYILKVSNEIKYDPAFVHPFLIGGLISSGLILIILATYDKRKSL